MLHYLSGTTMVTPHGKSTTEDISNVAFYHAQIILLSIIINQY